MTQATTKICILGGGFGGLYTALRLSQLPWESTPKPEIILVDQSDRFVFSPLLYELLTRELQTWEIAPPYSELLQGTGIQFHQAAVSTIDINKQTVQLQDKSELNYDRLVLALGGETPLDLVSGAVTHASTTCGTRTQNRGASSTSTIACCATRLARQSEGVSTLATGQS